MQQRCHVKRIEEFMNCFNICGKRVWLQPGFLEKSELSVNIGCPYPVFILVQVFYTGFTYFASMSKKSYAGIYVRII